MPRVLFYLPGVTPWWFERIVAPLIRTLAAEAEVHVLAPAMWRNTGLSSDQLQSCADLPEVRWHIVEDDTHPSLRTRPRDPDGLAAFVHALAPDVTLCRSADEATPARFPGTVAFLMEGALPPLFTPPEWIVLNARVFDQGLLPPLSEGERTRLRALADPTWTAAQAQFSRRGPFALSRQDVLSALGLPLDRPLVFAPLEYEHEENLFGLHHRFADNADFVDALAAACGDEAVAVVTHHPLTELHGDVSPVEERVRSLGGRVRLVPQSAFPGCTSTLLTKHADAMVVQNSKSLAAAAFFGRPLARLSAARSGEWLNASTDLAAFVELVRNGQARAPDAAATRDWFAFHLANQLFDPARATGAEILARCDPAPAPERWADALAHHALHAGAQS